MLCLKTTQELDWFEITIKKFQNALANMEIVHRKSVSGISVTSLKSIETNPTLQLTDTKNKQKSNFAVESTLKGGNTVYSNEHLGTNIIIKRRSIMPEIVIIRDDASLETKKMQQYSALMRYENFGKDSKLILESDKPIIAKFEKLDADQKEEMLADLRKATFHPTL